MPPEDFVTEFVIFYLPFTLPSSSLKAKVETPNAREETTKSTIYLQYRTLPYRMPALNLVAPAPKAQAH